MWCVYILECNDGRLYTGSTNDLDKRIDAHKKGKGAKFTRNFGVKKLRFSKKFPTKSDALKYEAQVKRLTREEKINIINNF